jgi:hypothetical protein
MRVENGFHPIETFRKRIDLRREQNAQLLQYTKAIIEGSLEGMRDEDLWDEYFDPAREYLSKRGKTASYIYPLNVGFPREPQTFPNENKAIIRILWAKLHGGDFLEQGFIIHPDKDTTKLIHEPDEFFVSEKFVENGVEVTKKKVGNPGGFYIVEPSEW